MVSSSDRATTSKNLEPPGPHPVAASPQLDSQALLAGHKDLEKPEDISNLQSVHIAGLETTKKQTESAEKTQLTRTKPDGEVLLLETQHRLSGSD